MFWRWQPITLCILISEELFSLRKVLKGYLDCMTSIIYHPDIPVSCPPPEGEPANCTIFRAIHGVPVVPQYLVARIHQTLESSGSQVEWNEHIADPIDDGGTRQIDVTIRRDGWVTLSSRWYA